MTRSHAILRSVTPRRRRKFEARAETLEGRQLLTAGTLDTSFDGDGYAVLSSTQQTKTSTPSDIANAVDVLADGKILVAGQGKGTFQVVRLLPGGQLDAGFGSGGRSMPLSGAARDMAVQSDGKIVLAGFTSVTTQVGKRTFVTHSEIALVRLLSHGSLDTSFGQGGTVLTGISTSTSSNPSYNLEDMANAVAIQADGKIVVGGVTYNGTASGEDSVLVRYNADGSLDTTFGQGGKVVSAWSSSDEAVSDLAVQPDGKIVVAGYHSVGGPFEPYVARFNADGSIDTSFGSGGLVTTPGASAVAAAATQGLALLPSGAVLASLKTFNGTSWDLAIARYNADGSLDTSFGGRTGYATVNLPGDEGAFALKVQPDDGKVVAAGFSHAPDTTTLLARFHADGSLDTGFGTGGVVLGGPFASVGAHFRAVDIQADGKIVAVGRTSPAGKTYPAFLVARYLGDSGSFAAATASVSALSSRSASASPSTQLATSSDHDLTQLATEFLLSASKRRGARALAPLSGSVHRAQG